MSSGGKGGNCMKKCVNGTMIEMTAEEVAELEGLRASIVEEPTEQDELNADLIKRVNNIELDLGR